MLKRHRTWNRGRAWGVIALAAIPVCAWIATVATTSTAGISDPKLGRYAGIGEKGSKVGFEVAPGEVQAPVYSIVFGLCSGSGAFPAASDQIDGKGRYRMDIDSSPTSETSLRGRFTSTRGARGRIKYEQTDPMVCPGNYNFDYAAGRIASIPATGGGSGEPRNGRYAGGAGDIYVWFNVKGGVVTDVRLRAEFPSCTYGRGIGSDDAPPDDEGRFSFTDVDPPHNIFFRGRFKTRSTLTGKVVWGTTDNCPAGSHEFPFRARRFEVPK